MSRLTATTSSGIALSNILVGALIAIGAFAVLPALDAAMSKDNSWNAQTAALLRINYAPLIVTFCAFIAFKTTQLL